MPSSTSHVALERIHPAILFVRGHRVLLDHDLARLYGVETRVLIQAVKRNASRFPADFVFQLTAAEASNLTSQSVISSWGGRRRRPYAFTEHGVAMLSAVLRSERAVRVSIAIVRTFVQLRRFLSENAALARRLAALERQGSRHAAAIREILGALSGGLQVARTTPIGRIGFRRGEDARAGRLRASRTRTPAPAR